jgi:tetratricopeptide (TPR) repeat protein
VLGRGRTTRTTAAVAIALALAAPLRASTPAEDFLALVTDARRGNVDRAVSVLLSWSDEQLVASASARLDGCTGPCLRAAALLFTEIGVLRKLGASKAAREAPRKAAERIIKSLDDDDFERRRRLAIGHWHQQWARLPEALGHYDEKYGTDADSLVAQGSVYEQASSLGMGGGWGGLGFSTHHLEDAADRYQRALSARPGHPEARLRLARVLQRRGQIETARQAFTQLLADDIPSDIRGYACLFLGELEQNDGHLEKAIQHFREAVAADPLLQPAHLSLSQSLHQAGQVREAADVMLAGLRATAGGPPHGWFSYHSMVLSGFRRSMDGLWAELRE